MRFPLKLHFHQQAQLHMLKRKINKAIKGLQLQVGHSELREGLKLKLNWKLEKTRQNKRIK
jgi:hypothetical protein